MNRTGLAWTGAVTCFLAGAAALGAALEVPIGASAAAASAADLVLATPAPQGPSDSLLAAGRDAHPFRPDRHAAAQPYNPATLATPGEPIAPAAPKPSLRLAGLLWSARPIAILEGVPNREGGVALAPGDTAGGLRVRRIERALVRMEGYDTVWVLTPTGTWTP